MERKIMVEVSEQEFELIKKGALEEKPKELTLEKATISQLVYEFLKRVPRENKKFEEHFDEKSNSVIGSCLCEITYWEENPAFRNVEQECIAKISVVTTGIRKKKENENAD